MLINIGRCEIFFINISYFFEKVVDLIDFICYNTIEVENEEKS